MTRLRRIQYLPTALPLSLEAVLRILSIRLHVPRILYRASLAPRVHDAKGLASLLLLAGLEVTGSHVVLHLELGV